MPPSLDNSDQTARIRQRWRPYLRIAGRAIRSGASPIRLAASRYPHRFPDPARPASLSIELTDACNLKCDYCANPTFAHPRTYMPDDVFDAVISQLDEVRADRIRICGGEPTLHPSFARFAGALARHTRFLSVVTNAQWRSPSVVDDLLRSVDLVEVSIDAGGPAHYERVRVGASFDRLRENLELLRRRRDRSGAPTLINVRLMVRPSTAPIAADDARRWAALADCVMTQHVIEQRGEHASNDVFVPVQLRDRTIPRCTMPFKDLAIRSDGSVPVCHVNGISPDPLRRVLLGHVTTGSLRSMWTGGTMSAVRDAHRRRDHSAIGFCRGCSGR